MDLKLIVELAVAPVHNDESIAYLESKISDHRQRYQQLFPNKKPLPKHHYLQHYPQLIRFFVPLVGLWTLRFEAKLGFFKNVTLSLAVRHQFMIGYHLSSPNIDKPALDVSSVSTVSLAFLKEELAQAFKLKYPDVSDIHTAKHVPYRTGVVVVHGSEGGLPEFGEIHQICILDQRLFFVSKLLCGWHREHCGAFELTPCPTRERAVVEIGELIDGYPLAAHLLGCVRMVSVS